MNGFSLILLVLAAFSLAAGLLAWHFSGSRTLLERWAEGQGFRILRSEHRNISRGPFFWTTTGGQTVYYVTVRDRTGNVRSGWVRCGEAVLGLMSERAEVRWDD